MATLTFDPTEPQDGEFTPEEQESLQIGEELAQQQEQLLAGKFKDAEDLEQAYIELQRKLGDNTREEQVEEPEEQQEEEEQVDVDFLERLWLESQDEYSEETLDALQNMDPADLAQMYLEYRAQNQQPETYALSDDDVTSLKDIAGGEEQYSNMMGWAQKALSPQEIEMYDSVMDRGDPMACFFAVQALAYRYNDANGVDGELLTGTAPRNQAQGFRSQAELVRAMSDPRYDNDPAYRADVAAKLEVSDLNF